MAKSEEGTVLHQAHRTGKLWEKLVLSEAGIFKVRRKDNHTLISLALFVHQESGIAGKSSCWEN